MSLSTPPSTVQPQGRHWPFVVAGLTFAALLVTAALRSAPAVLMLPLELHFGWDRASLSFTAATGLLLYGLVGPFAAAFLLSVGIRRTMLMGLGLMAGASFISQYIQESWQYFLTWGVLTGLGSGAITMVLASAVVNRWFAKRQGLMMGVLSAATATGSLIFLPAMAWLSTNEGWKSVVQLVSFALVLLIPLIWGFLPETPADKGIGRHGEAEDASAQTAAQADAKPSAGSAVALAIGTLGQGLRSPVFWLLAGTFFVCGLTTNGLVGVHLIAYCADRGIAPVAAAGLLTTMGIFDLVGTTASGWLTDRYDPRKLLLAYYGLRGLALIAFPFLAMDTVSLGVFAVFYGLDWIATVPPTVAIATRYFGVRLAPIMFGWILVGHQIGAAVAAFGAGLIRTEYGSYAPAFVAAGGFAVLAAFAALWLPRKLQTA